MILLEGTKFITAPTHFDCAGFKIPMKRSVVAASSDETLKYAGCDVRVGLPLVKKGFLGDVPSLVYAPSDEDCKKLDIRNDFVVEQSRSGVQVFRRGYELK